MNLNRDSVLIFANGVIEDIVWVRPYLAVARGVVAANGGLRHLLAAGRLPDVLIGDLDSLPEGFDVDAAQGEMEIIRHPAAKDETDLELALLLAARRYPDAELLILGGLGGRLDHALANILLLAHPRLAGRPVRFIHDRQSAWLVADHTVIDGRPGDTVSLIPLGGPARVAATTGLRWPLRDEMLAFGPARGVSNEMTAERATVRLESGMVLCIHIQSFSRPVSQ
jgi:thiamine pyrophosphokinase